MTLNNITKSLSVEILGRFKDGSKQAFSKARYKIKAEAFIDLNDTSVKAYYESGNYQLYQGKYLLLATDGSCYELSWEEELRMAFGVADNGGKKPMCMAKGVKVWDVLNQITVASLLDRYDKTEIRIFDELWKKSSELLRGAQKHPVLLLGDMHYPSFALMQDLQDGQTHFLFRCCRNFCREVVEFLKSEKQDAVLHIPLASDFDRNHKMRYVHKRKHVPTHLSVRAVRVTLPTEEYCLLTSLPSTEADSASIRALYPLRWSEEASFNFDKNRTEIENFSAKMPEGIRQEYYANTLYSNFVQLLVEDAQELIDEEQQERENKYKYKVNRSVAAGIVKDEIPKMLFGKESIDAFYERMLRLIAKHRQPYRPGRTFPRERKHRLRFSMNMRRPF